jgi:hypothetical protein
MPDTQMVVHMYVTVVSVLSIHHTKDSFRSVAISAITLSDTELEFAESS